MPQPSGGVGHHAVEQHPFLHGREIDGKVYIDDAMLGRMEDYLAQYGGK